MRAKASTVGNIVGKQVPVSMTEVGLLKHFVFAIRVLMMWAAGR